MGKGKSKLQFGSKKGKSRSKQNESFIKQADSPKIAPGQKGAGLNVKG